MNKAIVIGAGLAGCEAAWQLAQRGVKVALYEMKPQKRSPAHHSDAFAELVCSNSLRADRVQNAVGLLKQEMRMMKSLIIEAADATRVPAGGALAVDRDEFSGYITNRISNHPNIQVISKEIVEIPNEPCIIATGPLTSEELSKAIERKMGQNLYFFDAAAPIVTSESLDMTKVFRASRYGKGDSDDYLNCPMDKDTYFDFVRELVAAQTAELHEFESKKVFEGCMPVEVMAARGEMTLAFGPLKPVGLTDPNTGKKPFAIVQLRQENQQGSLYNLVGFQTHLKFPEQKRVFRMIPGLENAEFARFGIMHRNTFLHSPGKLDQHFQCFDDKKLFFAGQMTGVEGYVESAASGLVSGICMHHWLNDLQMPNFSTQTAHGALCNHVSNYTGSHFQPMNIAFGIIDIWPERIKDKQERYSAIAQRAIANIQEMIDQKVL